MSGSRVTAVALALACFVVAASSRAQSVDDVLTTVWETSWRQSGYPVRVSRWQGPLRVAFTGLEAERLKPHALQQLKTVAEVAGLDMTEAEEGAANVRVEFVDERGPLSEAQHCNTAFK